MTTSTTVDILDEAMTPSPPPSLERTYFGRVVIVDAWACTLVRGQGKVPFDPSQHTQRQKCIAIKLGIACESRDGNAYSVDQDVINSSKEWREFTLPSLQAIGKDLKSLQDCYVQVSRKPTGETYVNASGERKDRTALVFQSAYPDKLAMQAAADTFYFKPTPSAEAVEEAAKSIRKTPAPAPSVDRPQAAGFLDAMWAMSKQDKGVFWGLLKSNQLLAPHFTQPGNVAPELVPYLGELWDPEQGLELPF